MHTTYNVFRPILKMKVGTHMTMTVKEAIHARYSTRNLDPMKKISHSDIDTIIDAGRKAPSGLATEPWKFIIADGDMEAIHEAMFYQPVVASASHMIAILTYKEEYTNAHPEVFYDKFRASGYPEEQVVRTVETLQNRIPNQTQYFREQGFIAAAQMVLQATELGIGTVILGGFDPAAIAQKLNVDTSKYHVSLMIALGYPIESGKKERIIRPSADTVEKITLSR